MNAAPLPRSYPRLVRIAIVAFVLAVLPLSYLSVRTGQPKLVILFATLIQTTAVVVGVVAHGIADYRTRGDEINKLSGWKFWLMLGAMLAFVFPDRYVHLLPVQMSLDTLKAITSTGFALAMLMIVVANWRAMKTRPIAA